MSENPPAHLSDGHPPPKAVHHEIRNADNSAAYLIAKLRSAKERNPKLTLLDVGAGSGTISVSLAKHVPDGHVTGIDISADILSRAEAVADMAGVKNVDFCQGDVYNLPFPDATFDITHCHQVLTHLARPVDALREMIRVTKPGAIIAAREGDYETESVWPHSPILDKWHNFIAKIMKFAGGSSTAGRQLLPWALSAGVERSQIELSFSTWSYVIPSDRQTWVSPLTAQGLISISQGGRMREGGFKSGLVTEDELKEMAEAWEEWAKRDDASLAMINGEILIEKET